MGYWLAVTAPVHAWHWISVPANRQHTLDYSGEGAVFAVAILGTLSTIAMANAIGRYGFELQTEIALQAWGVVLGLIVASIGFQVLREQALQQRMEQAERESKQAQDDLAEKQKDLIKLLKTMPPAHALSTFTESYRSTLFQWRYRPTPDQDSSREDKDLAIAFLEKNIRASLNAIAQLFLHYEHKPLDTKCSAHLAEYIDISDIEEDKALEARVIEGIRFVDDLRDPFRGLHGVLHVNPKLSSFAEPQLSAIRAGDPDPKLTEEMFLPVPDCDDEPEDSTRSRALPIGPRAFRFGAAVYEDVNNQITREASKNWNTTQKVIQEVLEYVDGSEHGRIGSAAAYRLLWEVQSSEGEPLDASQFPKLGVLTIFTESPADMDGSVVSAYWDLVRPILELQKEMLLTIVELRA